MECLASCSWSCGKWSVFPARFGHVQLPIRDLVPGRWSDEPSCVDFVVWLVQYLVVRVREHFVRTVPPTMSRKWLIVVLLLSALGAEAQTINAASCNESDVATALNSVAADNTTVNIPAGTCPWSTGYTYNQVYSTTILGAGSQTTVGGGNATVIVDNFTTNSPLLRINLNPTKGLRMAGLTFQGGSGGVKDGGMIQINGPGTVRLDHDHFNFQTYTNPPRSFMVYLRTLVT